MINLFQLDEDHCKSVQYAYDVHLGSQMLELTQIIYNVHYKYSFNISKIKYKYAYRNHPFTIWAQNSFFNYQFLIKYCYLVNQEIIYRGFKSHKCYEMIQQSIEEDRIQNINKQKLFPFTGKERPPVFMPSVF